MKQSDANNTNQAIEQILETIRLTAAHYGLWLAETVHQSGLQTALEAEQAAGDRLMSIINRKLAGILDGKTLRDLLADLDESRLLQLQEALHTSWLAADGVWFQAVEKNSGMDEAKRVNDTCWARFAPLEAYRIKARLGLPEHPGLHGLKQALTCRMYAYINEWDFVDETTDAFTFRMNRCRVQDARMRKGLADYPCKSGGTVEYTGFARTVDSRIQTECIGCPPDPHPAEWVCAWRFTLPGKQ